MFSLWLHHRKCCKYKYPSNMSRIWNRTFKKQNNNCHVRAECKIRRNVCLWSSEQVQGVVHIGLHLLLSTAFCPWFRHLLLFTSANVLDLRSQLIIHQRKPFSLTAFTFPQVISCVSQNKAGKVSFYNFIHWSQHKACLLWNCHDYDCYW